jgi:hypothetical protein
MNGVILPGSSIGESVEWKLPEFELPDFQPDAAVGNAWQVIHTRYAKAIHSGRWDETSERTWLNTEFPTLIPASCGCGGAWQPLSDQLDLSTAENAFRSLWVAHNEVSTRHVQPPLPAIPYEQCRELWMGPRVAWLSAAYQQVGGTETFHRTLLPRLRHWRNIIGFVSTAYDGGDGRLLKVPVSHGVNAAKSVASNADVVVTWGIDTLREILPAERPKVIAVHHADWSSDWSNDLVLKQLDVIDEVVCVNEDVVTQLRAGINKPVHLIPNAVDPDRIKPTARVEPSKIVFWNHRLSHEKQPAKAIEIANSLPDGWQMVMAGGGQSESAVRAAQNAKMRYVGIIDSPAYWLSNCDCFLSLSTFEGYGLSVAEALAAGVPTVATPYGIASSRAVTLPADASASDWVSAIVNVQPIEPHRDLCDVDQFVAAWKSVIKTT